MHSSSIQYLRRNEIDTVRWNRCIENADNGLIYGCSWYLDNMVEHWDALVLNDYQAVMPLPWRKKFGVHYLYQPYFVPVLGLFNQSNVKDGIAGFLREIPPKFLYWDIDLNEAHPLVSSLSEYSSSVYPRRNFLLDLQDEYSKIKNRYSRLAKRSITKAHNHKLNIVHDDHPQNIINLYKKYYQDSHPAIAERDYRLLANCCSIAAEKQHLNTYTACTQEGEIVAFYLVLHDSRYVYSLLGGSTAKGKAMGAFYLLTDTAISDHAGSRKIFRFEGSDIPGIAFFNRQFGATTVHYAHLRLNRLPFPLKYFKK